ncbi:MAG TPA: hypothetical protein VE844_01075, partial [Gammaproteobacteria bacterium]|nr:hypothetical protein [Gammaproteobacteria bacterium]
AGSEARTLSAYLAVELGAASLTCRVKDWRGTELKAQPVSSPSPSGRVEDWRADGRVRWHNSIPFSMGLSPAPVITFPAPATSNPACRFPALGFPADFTPRVMGPIGWERFRVTDERLDSWKTT